MAGWIQDSRMGEMAYSIDNKLVVGVSSSAVFQMENADRIFRKKGVKAYREYQRKNLSKPFEKGVAFPFIKRLLNLNNVYQENPIEVVVLSRNDPESGERFYRTCQHYKLPIVRGAFLAGSEPYPYMKAFNCCLFLSSNTVDVKKAVDENLPAGLVLPSAFVDNDKGKQLRLAFDFDGVLADDKAEVVFGKKGLKGFHRLETQERNVPHKPGPLNDLLKKISVLHKVELQKAAKNPAYEQLIRIALVTARSAPANERLITTLKEWDIVVDETFFLGGIEKKGVLEAFKPHIFFDDQLMNLMPTSQSIPSVHIPFGITNRAKL
jgi:5'-nucleotidase